MWHGRDLRHFRRLLAPPLQQLLTGGGTTAVGAGSQGASTGVAESAAGTVAVLGRGLAAMPADVARQMGGAKVGGHAGNGVGLVNVRCWM